MCVALSDKGQMCSVQQFLLQCHWTENCKRAQKHYNHYVDKQEPKPKDDLTQKDWLME